MSSPSICNNNEKRPTVPDFCDEGLWEVAVTSLSEIKKADRDHAYILPDDSVWVLSHEGKKFIQLNLASDGKGQPTQITNNDGFIVVEGSGSNEVQIDLNGEQLDKKYQKKIIFASGGLVINERPTNADLSTNSLNLGTFSHDFSYFIIQSLHLFTIKIRIESAFYFKPKQGSIVREQIFKNRPQLSTVTKHAFYFDVAAKVNNSNVFENYTLTGFYQIVKDEEGGFVFTLSYTGMFKFDAEIPYNEKSILNDKNNVFSAEYTGNELQFIVRQKTVFI